jgi:hypothetical protein
MFTKREFLEESVALPNSCLRCLAKLLKGNFANPQNIIRNRQEMEKVNVTNNKSNDYLDY